MSPYRTEAEMPEKEEEPRAPFWTTERRVLTVLSVAFVMAHVGAAVANWGEITKHHVGGAILTDALVLAFVGVGYLTFPRSSI
jgi:hypothetical protein